MLDEIKFLPVRTLCWIKASSSSSTSWAAAAAARATRKPLEKLRIEDALEESGGCKGRGNNYNCRVAAVFTSAVDGLIDDRLEMWRRHNCVAQFRGNSMIANGEIYAVEIEWWGTRMRRPRRRWRRRRGERRRKGRIRLTCEEYLVFHSWKREREATARHNCLKLVVGKLQIVIPSYDDDCSRWDNKSSTWFHIWLKNPATEAERAKFQVFSLSFSISLSHSTSLHLWHKIKLWLLLICHDFSSTNVACRAAFASWIRQQHQLEQPSKWFSLLVGLRWAKA